MSTTEEQHDALGQRRTELRELLDRQRQAFVADGPPSVTVRRNRIDRLLALVLDNTEEFVDAMGADFGTRSRVDGAPSYEQEAEGQPLGDRCLRLVGEPRTDPIPLAPQRV